MTTEYRAVEDDVIELVQSVIEDYEELGLLREAHICVLYRFGNVPKKNGREVWGKASKFPAKWNAIVHALGGVEYDFLIELVWPVWHDHLDDHSRRALVFHELMHCEMVWSDEDDDYIAKIRGHDAELFVAELKHFGPWKWDLALVTDAARQPELPGIGSLKAHSGSVATLGFGDGSARPVADLEQLTEAVERVTP